MAKTLSTMLELGAKLPSFNLTDGLSSTSAHVNCPKGENGTFVMFICNHCPFVVHVIEPLVQLCKDMQAKGIGVVAINSNDVENYPDDKPELMKEFADNNDFSFPYLFDVNQDVAKSYKAACTPDFYLFDSEDKLFYRGQMDAARPGNEIPVTGEDLISAYKEMLGSHVTPEKQIPSMGCNIKWKSGNAPDYF